jgi:integrase/recombinase XerD
MTPLRRRVLEDMQIRRLSPRTQAAYVTQISLFARYFNRSPGQLGPEEIRRYQLYLINEKKLAPSSVTVALAALRFLYSVTLKRPWDLSDVIPLPKKPQRLVPVLSPQEVQQFLDMIPHPAARVILTICYATGLRISEAVAPARIPLPSPTLLLRGRLRGLSALSTPSSGIC